MKFAEFVASVGGEENIARVIRDEREVHFALFRATTAIKTAYSTYEVQGETYVKGAVSDAHPDVLAPLCRAIEGRQRLKAADFTSPVKCHFRPQWHISPPRGTLNDPNGFIHYHQQYLFCYQWYPYGCEHKDKHWLQLTSRDLVNWQWASLALTPSDWFDSHGVFSGHCVSPSEDELYAFYTGNTRVGEERKRQTTQCIAKVTQTGYEKLGPVIPNVPEGITEHCRDPKIIRYDNEWWMFLGAQTEALQGRLAVYTSKDLIDWSLKGIYGQELDAFGYMWECPDVFEIDGQCYLVFCPQGITSDDPYNTIPHHNRIAPISLSSSGVSIGDPQVLDHGFDFYAPQSAAGENGERIMIAWMGVPDEQDHPTCDSGWLHQMTMPRTITFESGQLLQRAHTNLGTLRAENLQFELADTKVNLETKCVELITEMVPGTTLKLFQDSEHELAICYDAITHRLIIDRSRTLKREGDDRRSIKLGGEAAKLHLFTDSSSFELFINDGQAVMTGRVFTPQAATFISCEGDSLNIDVYKLKPSTAPFQN